MAIDDSMRNTDIPCICVNGANTSDDCQSCDTELIVAAEIIIPEAFPNGLRKSSQIARKKFNTILNELCGRDIPDSINLDDLALMVGIEYEDKIYVPSKAIKKLIYDEILKLKARGIGVFFYKDFFNAFSQQFSSNCIFSPELLMKVIAHIMPNLIINRTYACFSKDDSLVKDIIWAYGKNVFMNYNEVKNRLPYADFDQIRNTCSRSKSFVSMGDEVYAIADRLVISHTDIETSKRNIETDINQNSFSMLNNINVEESETLNPGVTTYALKTFLFDKYLSNLYSRRRSLITKTGIKIRMYDVMRDYCLGFESVKVEELEAYECEVSGKFAYGLIAAFDSMVRIDKDTFVHRDLISFDIDAVDRRVSLYVKNDIFPIADIPSFTSFPYIEGYSWNVFLLDSFCSHYSKKYRSIGGPAQKGIIGAIYPIIQKYSNYSELLARVAADSGLELTDEIISNYFSKHKYLLRKSNINEVLAMAQEIRLKEE